MALLTRFELFKLRTVRVTYGLWAAVAALGALFTAIEASRAGATGSGVAALSTAAGQSIVTTTTSWSLLFAAVLGVLVASGEHRHSTTALTYLAEPRRERVLAAKALAAAAGGAVFGLTASAVAIAIGLGAAAGAADPRLVPASTLIGHAAGTCLGAGIFAAIGVGLGSLLRSQVAGIVTVLMWGLAVESVIGGLFTSVRAYLPYTAATTMAGIKLGNAAFGPAHGVNGGSPLPFAAAAALVAGVAALLCALAGATSVRRDI
ncbi:MAG TPA: hypothetical protein VME20_11210 [Acidimicrobiales bacterium]|nr:hypothetical protein [Acidimicrobiales bacterium]